MEIESGKAHSAESTQAATGALRHPLLVVVWSLGVFLAFQIIQFPCMFIGAQLAGVSFQEAVRGGSRDPLFLLGQGVASILIGLPWVLLLTKYLWRRSFTWLRLDLNWSHFLLGALLGIALPAFILLVTAPFASVTFAAAPDHPTVTDSIVLGLGGFGMFFFVGLTEELLFRGMAAREWAYRWNWVIATVVSGLFFGILHLPAVFEEPNLPVVIPWVMIAAVIGNLLFMALYLRGRSLALPIGFHTTWNMALSVVFGITLSGHEPGHSFFRVELAGPDIMTGGPFGIEAGLLTMITYLAVSAALLIDHKGVRRDLLPPTPQPSPIAKIDVP